LGLEKYTHNLGQKTGFVNNRLFVEELSAVDNSQPKNLRMAKKGGYKVGVEGDRCLEVLP